MTGQYKASACIARAFDWVLQIISIVFVNVVFTPVVFYFVGRVGCFGCFGIREAMRMSGFKISIDPGHGGQDPGAVGNGLFEKDINLTISLEVARLLRSVGQTVVLTRDTDRFIDLIPERAPAADISVSVHVNSGGGQGLETWVSLFNKPDESKRLGQAIQSGILQLVPFKDRGLKSKKELCGE
jgi:N-acetylmuramoyl-L-alanine amidase